LDQVGNAESEIQRLSHSLIELIWALKSPSDLISVSKQLHDDQVVTQGLLGLWSKYYKSQKQTSTWVKIRDLVLDRLSHPIAQAMMLPWVLPRLKNYEIPPDVFKKIVTDGLDAHLDLLRPLAIKQKRLQTYNQIRSYYTPFILTFVFAVYYYLAEQELHHQTEVWFEQTHEIIKQQQIIFETELPKFRQIVIEQAIKEAYRDFEIYWGEPPTPNEQKEISERIREKFKYHN